MRKGLAACRAVVVGLVFVFSVMVAETKAQPLDRVLSLRDLAGQLNTPDDIARYLWKNFTFEEDQRQFGKEEYWQSPEEFLETHKGDCEDFALFAHALLQMQGIPSFLLNIYSGRVAHTVCVFRENGRYQVIDESRVKRYGAKNLDELMTRILPFWQKGAIVTPLPGKKRAGILAEFVNGLKVRRRLEISS